MDEDEGSRLKLTSPVGYISMGYIEYKQIKVMTCGLRVECHICNSNDIVEASASSSPFLFLCNFVNYKVFLVKNFTNQIACLFFRSAGGDDENGNER